MTTACPHCTPRWPPGSTLPRPRLIVCSCRRARPAGPSSVLQATKSCGGPPKAWKSGARPALRRRRWPPWRPRASPRQEHFPPTRPPCCWGDGGPSQWRPPRKAPARSPPRANPESPHPRRGQTTTGMEWKGKDGRGSVALRSALDGRWMAPEQQLSNNGFRQHLQVAGDSLPLCTSPHLGASWCETNPGRLVAAALEGRPVVVCAPLAALKAGGLLEDHDIASAGLCHRLLPKGGPAAAPGRLAAWAEGSEAALDEAERAMGNGAWGSALAEARLLLAEQAVRAAFTLPAADADALALAAAAVRTARASAGASPGEPRPLLAQACGISLCVIGVFLPLRSIHPTPCLLRPSDLAPRASKGRGRLRPTPYTAHRTP
mmetsp:Transcript_40991/g.131055  ORF Transcript_40991/g.131055 Transcript_40991/m.131055 type:complete len:376 (-) Transcript_40991:86-1213(-)